MIDFQGSGAGDHVDCGAFDVPSGNDELTITSWVNFNGFGVSDARIVSKSTSTAEAAHYYMLSTITGPVLRARLKTGGTTTTLVASSGTLSTGVDYFAVLHYDGSTMTIYLDCVDVGNTPKSGNVDVSGSVELWIGENPDDSGRELDGKLEDLRIYSRALSISELETIMNLRGSDGIINGLEARWLMNEGAPGTAASGADSIKDIGPNGWHGTPSGSPPYVESILQSTRRRIA